MAYIARPRDLASFLSCATVSDSQLRVRITEETNVRLLQRGRACARAIARNMVAGAGQRRRRHFRGIYWTIDVRSGFFRKSDATWLFRVRSRLLFSTPIVYAFLSILSSERRVVKGALAVRVAKFPSKSRSWSHQCLVLASCSPGVFTACCLLTDDSDDGQVLINTYRSHRPNT